MREQGHYNVKYNEKWAVGFWCELHKVWFFPKDDWGYQDDNFDEIDERRIVREEPTE